jgi:hypothetical protein
MVWFRRRLALFAALLTITGLLAGVAFWWLRGDDLHAVRAAGHRIAPLHNPLGKPMPGDWLAQHAEPGQTFEQYRLDDLNRPECRPTNLYVQPLGLLEKCIV